MNVIICLDDKNGILFNKRRQSRDKVICDRVLELAKNSVLWMNKYSSKLFLSDKINVDSDFLSKAGSGDYCFVESDEFLACHRRIEKVIVYRWNKVYPSDEKISEDFLRGRKMVQSADFVGSSHEKITEEIYE